MMWSAHGTRRPAGNGQRMHKPLVITKELDKSSPLLYNALVTNEAITEWGHSSSGELTGLAREGELHRST